MSKKDICLNLYENINKYGFEYNKYVLPIVKDAEAKETHISGNELNLINPGINLEPFKNELIPIKPEICTFSFMTELEITKVKNEKEEEKLNLVFEDKLSKWKIKGPPRKLLIELFASIVKFSNKYKYDVPQTGAMLAMFYNTHLFISYHLFATPEEVYDFFKEYIYCHSISVPPYKTKIFEPKEANQLMLYFCSIYLRNLPLIRLLMFPNYGLVLKTKNPVSEEELLLTTKKEKGKKDKKKGKKMK